MPKLARRIVWIPLLISGALILNGCARNPTSSLFQDGRLFAIVDLDSGFASARYLTIQADIEGFEPMLIKVFDFDNKGTILDNLQLDVEGALNWPEVQGKPIDVLGKIIKGGSEVRVTTATYGLDFISLPPFKLDGNMSVRVFILDPDAPGSKRLQIRRSTFGSTL
ncbi:MAG: hypothetical protein HY709_01290 [Candidatus Latescibacteria bacterium]|nr:hypothetical protein [Candidatus Latescibacterota bacterium]